VYSGQQNPKYATDPPSNLVKGQVSTVCLIVWISPQPQKSYSLRAHLWSKWLHLPLSVHILFVVVHHNDRGKFLGRVLNQAAKRSRVWAVRSLNSQATINRFLRRYSEQSEHDWLLIALLLHYKNGMYNYPNFWNT